MNVALTRKGPPVNYTDISFSIKTMNKHGIIIEALIRQDLQFIAKIYRFPCLHIS